MQIILNVTTGPHTGDCFVLDDYDTFTIGRGDNVQFRIRDDPYFSRHHCVIELCPPLCFLRDIGSTNGTYVNNKKIGQKNLRQVEQVRLNDGDVIRGGNTAMKVCIQPDRVGSSISDSRSHRVKNAGGISARPLLGDGMETLPIGSGKSWQEPSVLHCHRCGRAAKNSELANLTGKDNVCYICPGCHKAVASELRPIDNYEVLEVIGRGALGPVYKARRLSSNTLVALKVASPEIACDEKVVQIFVRQMRLCAKLQHPNIVPIIEVGQSGEQLWIATEYVDGMNAAQFARQRGGTLPLGAAAAIVCHVLAGLEYAHSKNLVHRDVKPPNILVGKGARSSVARLSDLGLVKNMDEAGVSLITLGGEKRGTVTFMPPEQVFDSSQVKAPADIYAVGATFYWLLTGQFAYDFSARDQRGEVKDPFLIIRDDAIVPIRRRDPSIPDTVARVIEKSLNRDPEDRFESASEMARAIRQSVSGKS